MSRYFNQSLVFLSLLLCLVVLLLASDLVLHGAHAEDHQHAETAHDVKENDLEVDPVLQVLEIVGHLGGTLVVEDHEVDDDTDTKEVVHLEEESERALLTIEEDSIKLDQFIEGVERVVDEQEPVDEVVRVDVRIFWVQLSICVDVWLERSGEAGKTSGEKDRYNLVGEEESVITARLHPCHVETGQNYDVLHLCFNKTKKY